MALYPGGKQQDGKLAREKIPAIVPSAEPVQVVKPKVAAITAVNETRTIIPAGVAITEVEQES
jgi:hypothetical protein